MKELAGSKVLFIVENNDVPFDRRVWREALALNEAGAHVSVICPKSSKSVKKNEIINEVHIYRYTLQTSNSGIKGFIYEYTVSFLKTFFLVHKVLWQFKGIDVIHVANPPDIFWPLAIYLKLFRIKFIFDEHDLTPELYQCKYAEDTWINKILFKLLLLFQKLSYYSADAIISTNASYQNHVIQTNSKFKLKTFIVRNGPDIRYFKPVQPVEELKKKYKYLAAYIGIMGVQDGVDYILYAMNEIVNKKNFTDLLVYIIGSGEELGHLKAICNEMKLEDYIIFTGRNSDEEAINILSTADICLSPDPYNNFNNISTMNKVMEYMALGKPVVSFKLKEAIYSASDAGLYVNNNDPIAFAEGMIKLLKNKKLTERLGKYGLERVRNKLCWQKQIEDLLNTYRYVLIDNQS